MTWFRDLFFRSSKSVLADNGSLAANGDIKAPVTIYNAPVTIFEEKKEFTNLLTTKEVEIIFEAYETSELNRTVKYQNSIERTLSKTNPQSQKETLNTEQLISDFPQGAIIFAHSGFGKTTLSHLLLRKVIEKRRIGEINQLLFDVPLPDLADTELPILEFMQQRIVAHHPNITNTYLKDLIRNKGAILLCDGFDRLSITNQNKIKTEIKNLIRDYPKLQIFIFSRSAAKLEINLPELKLEALSIDEQEEILKLHAVDSWYWRKNIIFKLCSNPLLLERIIDYWKQEKKLPKSLEELFSFWLENLLCSNSSLSAESINREAALTLLAKVTINNPINKIKALRLLK